MSSITDLLAAILAAKKGEEVRGSIHDAIELCYQDGKAGASDLQARQLIEAVAAVNEEQAAALEVLQARVEELESGEGGSSQQSTTIDIPTVLVDGGVVESLNVNNNGTTTHHITFTTPFTEAPKVMIAIGKNAGAVSQYGYLSANILYPTVTTTGFDFFLANRTGSDRSPGVVWYAYQPTVKTIDLDITIPETEGMTEAEVREITGPIAAAVDALKTGYDGTTYQTAAEAVRTQINDLHVLIGDEPGTAISADSIGYGDGSVADALAGLNGRLDSIEQGGSGLTTEAKQALLALLQKVAYTVDDGQDLYDALDLALNPPAELRSISVAYTQSAPVYENSSLDDLKVDLVVTAHFSNGTTQTVTAYSLSGTLEVGTSTITVTYSDKTATFTTTVSANPLPAAYQRVEYVQGDGEQAVYLRRTIANALTGDNSITLYSFEVDAELLDTQPNFSTNMLITTKDTCWLGYNTSAGAIGVGTSSGMTFSGAKTDRHSYVMNVTTDGSIVVERNDGAQVTRQYTVGTGSAFAGLLGTVTSGGTSSNYRSAAKVYSYKMYYDGELIRDLVPCYRKSDDVVGLYDMANDYFYTPVSGAFTKGADVA